MFLHSKSSEENKSVFSGETTFHLAVIFLCDGFMNSIKQN